MPESGKDSPHGKGRYGEPQQRDLLGGVELPTHRRRRMQSVGGEGLFDTAPRIFSETPPQHELTIRNPLFKKGTVLYAANYRDGIPVLPFNQRQADDLAKETLEFDQNLEISDRCIGMGKRGREVIQRIGRSTYGAFVEVVIHTKDKKGEDITQTRFVRFSDRALARDNAKRQFKEANR